MGKHRAATPRANRRILVLAGLIPAGMLAAAGTATAQPDSQECGAFQVVCTDEVAEVNGPLVEANDIVDFQF